MHRVRNLICERLDTIYKYTGLHWFWRQEPRSSGDNTIPDLALVYRDASGNMMEVLVGECKVCF